MRPSASRPRRAAGLSALAVLAVGTAALSAPPTALPTTEVPVAEQSVTETYRVLDAKGKPKKSAKWTVSTAGGNCCEAFVHATSTGRLVEFGGTYPLYSDDAGKTWKEIQPLTPSTSRLDDASPRQVGGGEGAIVAAPGGDIVGIGWDPYSGDRLQPFLYDASDDKWYYGEWPLHEPFYDRQWISVAKGPFNINGQTVPWVSLVLSNFNRKVVLMSTDGINYFVPSQPVVEGVLGTVDRPLTGPKDPDLDYMQEHAETRITAVPGGGALSTAAVGNSTCATQLLGLDGRWSCYGGDGPGFKGAVHADSRGWLHDVDVKGSDVTYRISKDGGVKWVEKTFTVPGEANVESFDYKAHGKLGLTALAVHALTEDRKHQDMVMRFDTKSGTPKLRDTLLVGKGDYRFTAGLDVSGLLNGAKSYRFDFASVAILPNGKIAVAFADKKYDDPAVAVLQ